MKKSRKPKFFSILLIFSIVPLLLSITLVTIFALQIINQRSEESSKQKLFIVATNLSSHCKEHNITFATSDQYNEYLDSLLGEDIEMAILLDKCPAVTSIKNESGYRVREVACAVNVTDDEETLRNGGYYDRNVVIEEQVYYAYYVPIYREDTIIGIAMAAEKVEFVTGGTRSVLILILSVSSLLIVAFTIACFIAGKKIEKGFLSVNQNMELLASGDMGRKKPSVSIIREMDSLAKATDSMQDNLSTTIGKVQDLSNIMVNSVGEVAKSSQNSTNHAAMITESMDEVVSGAAHLTENVSDISDQMDEIGNHVNDISSNANELFNSSKYIMDVNEEAKESLIKMLENSRQSVRAVDDIARQIDETNKSIAQIDTVVELILGIADQTSLLSLNASIEAARAGEFGRGFSVVAEEIRKLAEQSSEGAEQIREMAIQISEKSQISVQKAEEVKALIDDEQRNLADTNSKYEKLSQNLEYSVNEIHKINDKVENLSNAKEIIIGKIYELSAISEENMAANEEVTANVTQIISDFERVNTNCEELNEMAKDLKESISFFKI